MNSVSVNKNTYEYMVNQLSIYKGLSVTFYIFMQYFDIFVLVIAERVMENIVLVIAMEKQ